MKKFFETLPILKQVGKEKADIAWLIYDLVPGNSKNLFQLKKVETVYTEFEPALAQITRVDAGPVEGFIEQLQAKLDEKLEGEPPDTLTLVDPELT